MLTTSFLNRCGHPHSYKTRSGAVNQMPGSDFAFMGGRTVSKETEVLAEANLKRGQELINTKKPREALPFLLKVMDDPEIFDACGSIAMKLPQDLAIEFLLNAELKSHRHLQNTMGPDCFELTSPYGAPDFWGLIETRPYMRLPQNLVRLYVKAKRWDEAVATNIEILRICESDNMGQRKRMAGLLLHAGRPADALYFVQCWLQYDEPPTATSIITFAPPRRTPMPDAQVEKMKRWVDLEMVYSAALARQYLHMAAQYPLVLIKVIGKFKERVDGDKHPSRTMNSPEDARDRLWLAQDLWMQDAPWNWVSRDPFEGTGASRMFIL
ncbi:hypothetical protein B0H14DRAFT_2497782 [Mycena olivaceomarginata]|nr:hypothetical protein B0H14DRAFT_2497782 [Mycena olivaceomarginata]